MSQPLQSALCAACSGKDRAATRRSWGTLLSVLLLAGASATGGGAAAGSPAAPLRPDTTAEAAKALRRLPLLFEELTSTQGKPVCYRARGGEYNVILNQRGVSIAVPGGSRQVEMRFAGMQSHAGEWAASGRAGSSNYLLGNDPARWRFGVSLFEQVRRSGVYPGIDVLFHSQAGGLEYDFLVAPGANPRHLRLELAGVSRAALERDGSLALTTSAGTIRHRRPVAYQETPRGRRRVRCYYRLAKPTPAGAYEVTFALGSYDRQAELVLDPVLSFSSYLGGKQDDEARDVALGPNGCIYVVGSTKSADFPTVRALDSTLDTTAGTTDAFVACINLGAKAGRGLICATYWGGSGDDAAHAVAVDLPGTDPNEARPVYVVGTTKSANFPANLRQGAGSNGDAFFSIFSVETNGLLAAPYYGAVLGGGGLDEANDVAVTRFAAFITGTTTSADDPMPLGVDERFPRLGAEHPVVWTGGGDSDGFLARFRLRRDALITPLAIDASPQLDYASWFGGPGADTGAGVAVHPDAPDAVYLTGTTDTSADFLTVGALSPPVLLGGKDAYVLKASVTQAGTATVHSSYLLGGNDDDEGAGIVAAASGEVSVVGTSHSVDAPSIAGPIGLVSGAENDAFVATIDTVGSAGIRLFARLGGEKDDQGHAIARGENGDLYLVGRTDSSDLPLVGAVGGHHPGIAGEGLTPVPTDAFLIRLTPNGDSPAIIRTWTYYGGQQADIARSVAVLAVGEAVVVGSTASGDDSRTRRINEGLVTARPIQPALRGEQDAFVAVISSQHTGALQLSRARLNFGVQELNHGKTLEVRLKNVGKGALTLVIGNPAGPFALRATRQRGRIVLAPKETTFIAVQFVPTIRGRARGVLVISNPEAPPREDGSPARGRRILLTGKGR